MAGMAECGLRVVGIKSWALEITTKLCTWHYTSVSLIVNHGAYLCSGEKCLRLFYWLQYSVKQMFYILFSWQFFRVFFILICSTIWDSRVAIYAVKARAKLCSNFISWKLKYNKIEITAIRIVIENHQWNMPLHSLPYQCSAMTGNWA